MNAVPEFRFQLSGKILHGILFSKLLSAFFSYFCEVDSITEAVISSF
jgi:hypothetical protein